MFYSLTVVFIVGLTALVVGAIFGPTILKLVADAKGEIRKGYEATIADLTAAKTKAETDLQTIITSVKSDANTAITALKTRAESAENDLASFKRLVSVTATAAPVVASIPPPPVAPGVAYITAQGMPPVPMPTAGTPVAAVPAPAPPVTS